MEISANLNDIKHPRDIERESDTNTSKKRHSSISPLPSPEFPPFKRRKFDLAPSSPEVIPSSQPDVVDQNDSIDGPTSPTVPVARSSNALPLLCPTPYTPTKAESKLRNVISSVPTPCPLGKQKTKPARTYSPRSPKSAKNLVNSLQGANITEHSRASFPPQAQIPPGRAVDDHRTTPHQVGISHTVLNKFWLDLLPTDLADI